ncbi:tetratricopeptide repeat protein [Butyrivibrio sp. X503]|uniref:tetratricopeptide repeat protein n=1 Tax=Butyrivibrio sp. X503 TaxID=2364878 RepID=UPI0013149F3D|nr:tetratricopeptide repeat protein [Butyrivibrio sp. X503]
MKKTPLKYKLMIIFAVPVMILAVSFLGRVIINHGFVKAYAQSQYKTESEKKLLNLNFPESFIPYYNLGNVCYERQEYESAVGYYQKALSLYPDAKRECSIRINLALAYCNTIDFYDLDSQEKIDSAIFKLNMARDVLLENGWAVDEGDDYRDKDAQQLKEDIDKMIEKLKNPDQSSSDDNQNNNNNNNQDEQDNSGSGGSGGSKEDKQKEKLEGNKKGAMEERRKEQQEYQNEQKEKEKENQQNGSGEDQQNENNDQNGEDQNNGGNDDQDGNNENNGDDEQNGGSEGGEDEQNGGSGGNNQNGGSGSNGQLGGSGQGDTEGDVYIKQW